jgi:lysosomal acid lipase/cholesteryl ester hydrolase
MARLPFIGRLSWREYAALVLGFLFIALERLIRLVIFFLPRSVIDWFYDRSRNLFDVFGSVGNRQPRTEEDVTSDKILKARDFGELCALFGYAFEEHIVRTKDGYLLGMHRISSPKGEHKRWRGSSTGKPVVYLHHGLLMNSEVWVCLNSEERSLPFALASAGYDVWLGNNRGNKYSKKSIHDHPNSSRFWDFSIDDFAWYDIPDTIEYILDMTGAGSVGYVGFSQGTAQAFAALSIHPKLNEKVNVFIALAPALSPEGLAAPIVDGLMKASCVSLAFPVRAHTDSAALFHAH